MSTAGVKGVAATSATLSGAVNPEGQTTTYYFQYGTSTAYGSTAPSTPANAGSGTKNVNVSAPAGSLAPNTTYHYRLVATNASGTTVGTDRSFKTKSAPPTPGAPAVSTGGARAVSATSATLTGAVNPEGQATTYSFEYGTSTTYGSTAPSTPASAGSGTKNINVSAAAASLAPNTTYHYRLVATNASGTTTGADHAFKTPKPSTGITISASPNPVVYGQATAIAGSVLGPGAGHTAVTLQRSGTAAGPFVNVATTTAGPKGTYSFPGLAPSSNTYYRALANGASSAPALLLVRFRVSFFVGTTHPVRGQLVRFHGRIAPRHNGARVQIQRLGSDGRWHTIARALLHRTRTNASVYSIRLRVRHGGLYRTMVRPDAHHARGFSRVIRIRVH